MWQQKPRLPGRGRWALWDGGVLVVLGKGVAALLQEKISDKDIWENDSYEQVQFWDVFLTTRFSSMDHQTSSNTYTTAFIYLQDPWNISCIAIAECLFLSTLPPIIMEVENGSLQLLVSFDLG